jgi:hypothetical protein
MATNGAATSFHTDSGCGGNPPRHPQETALTMIYNGMSAAALKSATWQKSRRSNSQGNCVEMARISGDAVAVRNSRHPQGPALIYTLAEIEALILGAKDGDFDNLLC